jgi:hypothetical protein
VNMTASAYPPPGFLRLRAAGLITETVIFETRFYFGD